MRMTRRTVVWLCIGYVIIFAAYTALIPKLFGGRLEDASQFGEMFGAFGAFCGGLAFLGVVYTVWLQSEQLRTQSEELRLQREELERTRAELARAATAQERSEHALTAQLRASAISGAAICDLAPHSGGGQSLNEVSCEPAGRE